MLEYVKICPNCGFKNPETEVYCCECNYYLDVVPEKDTGIDSPKPENHQPGDPAPEIEKKDIVKNPGEQSFKQGPITKRMESETSLLLELVGTSRQYQVRSGDIIGQEHPSSQAQIQLSGVEGVNFIHRHHCQFEYKDGEWYVTPLIQSQSDFINPSSLNIQRMQPGQNYKITNGDKLTMGRITFLIRIFS